MYHEITAADIRVRRRNRLIAVAVVVLLAVLAVFIFSRVRAATRDQGAAALRSSILAAAEQCCATEGSYPASVEYLEQNYGLSINTENYIVTYESFASNMMPSVVVITR